MGELRLADLRVAYDDTVALDDVSLTVRDGEFFTLVGPSGCGKTTTLRAIAGLVEPTAGTVQFAGRDVRGTPIEERDVGVVFQNYALFPHMSVRENVAYGLRFADPPGGVSVDERVEELLELVDLADTGDRDPETLSGGQRQRIALARALAPGPELLLLDEPMSALDARLRERLRRQIVRIQSELDVTTVYVTHDQSEALAVSDRLAVMHAGRVEQVGTPREVYDTPTTRFVAEFVGENNLFDGRVVDHASDGGRETCVVAVGDREFHVTSETPPPVGASVTVCVRPEVLARDGATNRFPVVVETTEFLGVGARSYGDWDGRRVVFRTPDPEHGDRVTLGFDPADARLLR